MISIIFPTKNRVNNLKELFDSLNETIYDSQDVEVILYVDHDDPVTLDFVKSGLDKHIGRITTSVTVGKEKVQLGETYNRAYRKAKGDIIMFAADDVRFRTKNWDKIIKQEYDKYEDKIALVFGPDGIQPNGTLATHGFVSRKAVEAIGYVCPGGMGYNYSDNWLTDIYRKIKRLVYVPVYFEHAHWGVGKAEYDETYRTGSDAPHPDSLELWQKGEAERDKAVAILEKLKLPGDKSCDNPEGNAHKFINVNNYIMP